MISDIDLHAQERAELAIIDDNPDGTVGGLSKSLLQGRHLGLASTFDILARKH